MTEALLVSSIVGWLFVLGLTVAVLALARQIGVLHERIRPVGALALGHALKAGEVAPEFKLAGLSGGAVVLGGASPQGRATLLFFLSPTCPVCKVLLPVVKSVQDSARAWLRIVLASDGDAPEHLEFIRQHSLERFPYVLSTQVGMAYQVVKLPYAVLIGVDGSIVAHGLINNREHLESLFEAARLGHATTQDYLQAREPA